MSLAKTILAVVTVSEEECGVAPNFIIPLNSLVAVQRLLWHSWHEIGFEYDGLTSAERKCMSRDEHTALLPWVLTAPETEVLMAADAAQNAMDDYNADDVDLPLNQVNDDNIERMNIVYGFMKHLSRTTRRSLAKRDQTVVKAFYEQALRVMSEEEWTQVLALCDAEK